MSITNHETRSEMLCRIAREAWNAKAVTLADFSRAVVGHYFGATAPASINTNLRLPSAASAVQMEADETHNRQIIERLIKGTVKAFPADLEEAWVLALPSPFHDDALGELAGRHGLLPARLRSEMGALAWAGDLSEAMGQVMTRFAPIAEDGVINHLDRPHIKPFLAALAQAQGVLASLHAQAAAALADVPPTNVHDLKRVS